MCCFFPSISHFVSSVNVVKKSCKTQAGWLAGCLAGWLAGWLARWLAAWQADWVAGWLTGWLAGWLGWLGGAGLAGLPGQGRAGWLAGWPAGWLAAWLPGCLADRLSLPQPRWSGAARPPRAPRPPRWSRLPIGSETSSKKMKIKCFFSIWNFIFRFWDPPGDPQIEKKKIFFWAHFRSKKKCFFF